MYFGDTLFVFMLLFPLNFDPIALGAYNLNSTLMSNAVCAQFISIFIFVDIRCVSHWCCVCLYYLLDAYCLYIYILYMCSAVYVVCTRPTFFSIALVKVNVLSMHDLHWNLFLSYSFQFFVLFSYILCIKVCKIKKKRFVRRPRDVLLLSQRHGIDVNRRQNMYEWILCALFSVDAVVVIAIC